MLSVNCMVNTWTACSDRILLKKYPVKMQEELLLVSDADILVSAHENSCIYYHLQ